MECSNYRPRFPASGSKVARRSAKDAIYSARRFVPVRGVVRLSAMIRTIGIVEERFGSARSHDQSPVFFRSLLLHNWSLGLASTSKRVVGRGLVDMSGLDPVIERAQ